jgi:hypothetical protein
MCTLGHLVHKITWHVRGYIAGGPLHYSLNDDWRMDYLLRTRLGIGAYPVKQDVA